MIPYLWWLAILAMISVPVRAFKDPETLGRSITGVFLGGSYAERPFTTFWFFTALFVATVVYRYLTMFPMWVRLSTVAAGLLANMLFGSELAAVPFAAATALGALVFLEVGHAARIAQDKLSVRGLVCIAVACLTLAVAALLIVEDFIPIDMKGGQFPPLAVAVAALIGVALLLAATSVPSIGGRMARLLEIITAPSLAVIILHPLVLWVLRPESGMLPLWVITVAAFFLPLAVGLILARTAFASSLLGLTRAVSSIPIAGPGSRSTLLISSVSD